MSIVIRGFLLICAMAFLAIGVNTFADPLAAMAPVELNVNTVSALNELRSNYGGLQIGMGVWLLFGLLRPAFASSALLSQCLLVGGLAAGRVISIAIDGMPNPFVQGLLALEIVTAVLSWVFYLRNTQRARGHLGSG